jgi:TonB family protein
MNCTDIATTLAEHRTARLTAAERGQADRHLMTCEDCAAAWCAHAELEALPIPAVPPLLLQRIATAVSQHAAPRPRRALRPAVIGAALLAGAALAAMTTALLRGPSLAGASAPTSVEPVAGPIASVSTAAGLTGPLESSTPANITVAISPELVELPLDLAPVSRHPPEYPPAALQQKLEGRVVLRYDVSATGVVENVRATDSTNPLFEPAAIRAVSQWRYLPRIVAGKRVRVADVNSAIQFALGPEVPASKAPAPQSPPEEAARTMQTFMAGLEVAVDRFAADDIRGAELQLDELQALYEGDRYAGQIKHFEGYLHTVQGRYDRAIEAYEAGIAASVRSGTPWSGQWLPLSNLYFARHQYDLALGTLLSYRTRLDETRSRYPERASLREPPEMQVLIERLRALGVTAETLSPRR